MLGYALNARVPIGISKREISKMLSNINKIKKKQKEFLSYDNAKLLVKKLKLNSTTEWKRIKHFNKNLSNIPSHPEEYYKNTGHWKGWYDFAGFYNIPNKIKYKFFYSFKDAKKQIKKMKIKSFIQWRNYVQSENFDNRLPKTPDNAYKNRWKSWPDFLSNKNTIGMPKKYRVNEKIFDKWTHEMAYILGFWFADGNTDGITTFSISQHKTDKYILERILKYMKSNYPLYSYKCNNNLNFTIRSKKIVNTVIKLGGRKRKTNIMCFPNVPKEYLPDFIRGYFDGDGCINFHKKRKYYRSQFTSSSKKFLKKLKKILLVEARIISHIYYKNGTTLNLSLSANSTRKLGKYMYRDRNELKLIRKYIKFQKCGDIVIQTGDRKYLNYKEAKKFIKSLNLKSAKEWGMLKNKPENMPSDIYNYYGRYKQFKGLKEWIK